LCKGDVLSQDLGLRGALVRRVALQKAIDIAYNLHGGER
jgi:hypothetical protein